MREEGDGEEEEEERAEEEGGRARRERVVGSSTGQGRRCQANLGEDEFEEFLDGGDRRHLLEKG